MMSVPATLARMEGHASMALDNIPANAPTDSLESIVNDVSRGPVPGLPWGIMSMLS